MLFATTLGLAFTLLLGFLSPTLLSQTLYRIPEALGSGYIHHYGGRFQSDNITSDLSTYIRETMDISNITGMVVGIVPQKGAPGLKAWGYRSESGEEMTSDTLFHMASVSKAFCAAALGILIDDFTNGRNVTALPLGLTEITWRTRVADLLPGEWELMDKWASERANLKDILSHVSGVPRHDFSYGPSDTPLSLIKRLKYLRPAFELREKWSYSNIMYAVGAQIVAEYADQSYTSFVEERIFTPLNMTYSTFSPSRAEAFGKFSQGWTYQGRLLPELFTPSIALLSAGPGGVISNAIDMSKWLATWLNQGVYEGKTIIPLSVYQNASYSYAIVEDHPVTGDSVSGYGMGWERRSYHGHDVVEHSGGVPGYSTWVAFLPNDGFGVLVFANSDNQDQVNLDITNRVIDSVSHNHTSTRFIRGPLSRRSTDIDTVEWNMTLSLNDLAGTYTNPGYGTFTLCSPGSNSSYCSQVHADFAVVDAAEGSSGSTLQLLAAWPRVLASHVRMVYIGGPFFALYMPTLFPQGYGRNTTPFETLVAAAASAEFVIEDGEVVGFGVTGFVGDQIEFPPRGTTVQDTSEVWFQKI